MANNKSIRTKRNIASRMAAVFFGIFLCILLFSIVPILFFSENGEWLLVAICAVLTLALVSKQIPKLYVTYIEIYEERCRGKDNLGKFYDVPLSSIEKIDNGRSTILRIEIKDTKKHEVSIGVMDDNFDELLKFLFNHPQTKSKFSLSAHESTKLYFENTEQD
jgi:hypothetical protein